MRSNRQRNLLILSGIAALALQQSASAALAVSNLDQTVSTTNWGVHVNQFLGMSFVAGSGQSQWTLDSVDMRLSVVGTPGYDFTLELCADAAGLPGAPIAEFMGSAIGVEASYNFVPSSQVSLDANSTYWLVAKSPLSLGASNGYGWRATSSTAETGLAGWSIGNNLAGSFNQGSSWAAFNVATPMFAVNATPISAVPEPSAPLLGALGVLLAFRRSRRA